MYNIDIKKEGFYRELKRDRFKISLLILFFRKKKTEVCFLSQLNCQLNSSWFILY